VIGALATGALAKAQDVGGQAITDAYGALKGWKNTSSTSCLRAVVPFRASTTSHSETAQAALAEALTRADLARLADGLRAVGVQEDT